MPFVKEKIIKKKAHAAVTIEAHREGTVGRRPLLLHHCRILNNLQSKKGIRHEPTARKNQIRVETGERTRPPTPTASGSMLTVCAGKITRVPRGSSPGGKVRPCPLQGHPRRGCCDGYHGVSSRRAGIDDGASHPAIRGEKICRALGVGSIHRTGGRSGGLFCKERSNKALFSSQKLVKTAL